jgi:hypothetical protein
VVAVKMFEGLRLDQADDKVINELRMEAQMMDRLSNHPNIVKFVGAITRGAWSQPPPRLGALCADVSMRVRRGGSEFRAGDGVLSSRFPLRPAGIYFSILNNNLFNIK